MFLFIRFFLCCLLLNGRILKAQHLLSCCFSCPSPHPAFLPLIHLTLALFNPRSRKATKAWVASLQWKNRPLPEGKKALKPLNTAHGNTLNYVTGLPCLSR